MRLFLMKLAIIDILLMSSIIGLHAQVTIGSGEKTNIGSVLDLKEDDGQTINSSKGLMLPRVILKECRPAIGELAQSIGATGNWDEKSHIGLLVYNIQESLNACGGVRIGTHIWNGVEWVYIMSYEKVELPKVPPFYSTDIYVGANSYIIKPYGDVKSIPIKRGFDIWRNYEGNDINNGKVLNLSDINNLNGVLGANVVWQEADDESKSDVLDATTPVTINGTGETASLVVKSGKKTGNALVNVTINNKVLWQWHIWVSNDDPTAQAYIYKTEKQTYWYMDRYLGGSKNEISGLYYQWGRPTPIRRGAVDITLVESNAPERINLAQAIQTDKFITYVSSLSHDWYSVTASKWNTRWGDQNYLQNTNKSPFDPCPEGWRVPSAIQGISPWQCLTIPAMPPSSLFAEGWMFDEFGRNIQFFATSGYRSNGDGSLGSVGQAGYVWSATPIGAMAGFLYLDNEKINPWFQYNRANGMSVRCVKEVQ